jgi:OOP family OmpA-OmpF porin
MRWLGSSRACRLALAGALGVGVFCVAPLARAGCDVAVLSPCIDADTFWPHAGPSQFMTVGGTDTVASERIAFGLVSSYLYRPIVIHTSSPGPNGSDRAAVENQIDANFLFAYGLTDRLELDLALPVTVFQNGAGTSPITGGAALPTTATRDLRFGVTFSILGRPRKNPERHDASGFGLAARFETVAPTGDDGAFASERGAVFAPSIALDYRSHRFFIGGELGLRVRPVTDFLGARIGTEGLVAAGVGVDALTHERLTLTAEARALPVFVQQADVQQDVTGGLSSSANGKYIVPLEVMATARSAPFAGGDFSMQLGFGFGIPTQAGPDGKLHDPTTVPAVRIALGLTFAPHGRDTDGDGVLDAIDRCPTEPGPKASDDGPGCPEKPKTP